MEEERADGSFSLNNLSEDIVTNIVLRLPVKSVARFKCLSKYWNHFISHNPYFRKNYLEFGGSPLMLGFFYHIRIKHRFTSKILFYPTSDEGDTLKNNGTTAGTWGGAPPFDESLSFVASHEKLYMITSSNGFLLCILDRYENSGYIVCNPVTKQWFSLPEPKNTSYNVVTSFTCHGEFNQHPHYKVVRALPPEGQVIATTLTIEILHSDDQIQQWKELTLTCPCHFELRLDNPGHISEKGVIYWSAFIVNSSSSCRAALVFDCRQEHALQLETIILPSETMQGYRSHFGLMNGLIVYLYNRQEINLWVLDEQKKEWCLQSKYTARVEHSEGDFAIEGFHPLEPHLLLIRLDGGKKVWYNAESKKIKLLPHVDEYFTHLPFIPYLWPSWPPSFSLFK